MRICGPKLALCGVILSIWGIIQLGLMGVFFWIKCVSLVEDVGVEEEFETQEEFYALADKHYEQNAVNCWIAAAAYGVTFLFSGFQFYLNSKSSA